MLSAVKSHAVHGPAAPRVRFLQYPVGRWFDGVLERYPVVLHQYGDEFVALLMWDERVQRFTPLSDRYIVPVHGGRISWRYEPTDGIHDGMPVEEFVEALRAQQGPETVSFPTADGGVVYADVYGGDNRAVVLAHGGRFTKESWAEQAPVLAAAGFRVVAIDFRGRGRSHGSPQEGSANDVYFDVLAAVRYLRDSGARTVSVIGASFGGAAAAQAAVEAEPGEIDRLVLLAHGPIEEPERMQGAKLFIVARDDLTFRGTPRLVGIRDQYERAPGPKELVILEGSAHAQFIFETDQAERLMDTMLQFLAQR